MSSSLTGLRRHTSGGAQVALEAGDGEAAEWTVKGARWTLVVRAPAGTAVSAAQWPRRVGVWRLLLCASSAAQRWEFVLQPNAEANT